MRGGAIRHLHNVMPAILTPLDLFRRSMGLMERTLWLAGETERTGMSLLIGHADRDTPHDRALKAEMARFGHVRIVSERAETLQANAARLRNLAASAAESDILLLLDADIAPDAALFSALAEQVEAGAPFAMAPCLYLSKQGTLALSRGRCRDEIVESTLNFSVDLALHWAMPSSIMAVRRDDYRALGGFCEEYSGHGYEDLDFMLRLALYKKIIASAPDLLIDQPYRAPLLAEGFRGALGAMCVPNLLDGHIGFHLFHERDDSEDYYRCRKDNARLFQSRMAALLPERRETVGKDAMPPMIPAFFAQCQARNLNPARFHALFDARPRHMLSRRPLYSRLWRRLRQQWRFITTQYTRRDSMR